MAECDMRPVIITSLSALLLLAMWDTSFSQTLDLHGQASGWLTGNEDKLPIAQAGARYIPDLFLKKMLNDSLYVDAELSLNAYAVTEYNENDEWESEGKIKPYRMWARFASDRFEARGGLQKINFGSAALFRPLMWFDHIDPRDPLKLTDGVYGLLLRYYFQNNANVWLWGLYGNDEVKGWETAPTGDNAPEYGGRVQLPVIAGEAGFSYHHRRADFSQLQEATSFMDTGLVNENRYAFDIKIDVEIGLWFEGAITHRDIDIPAMEYQRMWTAGADYTFAIGNGVTVLAEYFSSDSAAELFGDGEGTKFAGLSIDYPVGLLDRLSIINYYDFTNGDNYISLNWQRTYDNLVFHLIGFINPDTADINETQAGGTVMSGKGFQLMIVFNH